MRFRTSTAEKNSAPLDPAENLVIRSSSGVHAADRDRVGIYHTRCGYNVFTARELPSETPLTCGRCVPMCVDCGWPLDGDQQFHISTDPECGGEKVCVQEARR